MRKLYSVLFLACFFAGCSKNGSDNPKPDPPVTTATSNGHPVDYEFTANVAGPYSIQYADASGNTQTETITTATWSKKFNITVKGEMGVGFSVTNVNHTTGQGTASVTIDNVVKVNETFSMTSTNYMVTAATIYFSL
jgi:hypothetical protein